MLDSDIKTFLSAEVSSASTNGGRMSVNQVVSGVVNNVFPHVSRAQRATGLTTYRKIFVKNSDDTDGTMLNSWQWIERFLAAGDWVVMFFGTQTDTQASIAGSERKYGYGFVKNAITAGGSTIVVTVPDSSLTTGNDQIFKDGDSIRLSDMATPDAATGNEEFLTISGVPTVSGNDVTITVAETIANNYAAWDGSAGGHVVSYYDVGDIVASVENFVDTAAGTGAYDDSTYPVTPDNIGAIEDTVTITFTDATNFSAVGSSGINYGSGSTASDFAPTNSDFSKPYFTLEAAGFSGTWAAGDTIVFDIHPASYAIWLKRVVPASCPSLANNKITSAVAAESAV